MSSRLMQAFDQRAAARRTLSREVGFVQKPHVDRMRVGLAFPNTYFVGMSNLGFQTVYRLFNEHPDTVCERVFLPPKQELRTLLDQNARLVTIESGTRLDELDVLAFSVSFEWDYTNVLTMLRLAGLPLRAAERDHRHPLVVLGGAVTFVNPEPLALYADVVAAGEGEVLVPSLLEAVAEATSRRDLLLRLAARRGFYVPSFYDVQYGADGTIDAFVPREGTGAPATVRKAALKATDAVDPPSTTIFTPDTEFGSRFLVEVVRGCANLCRFCWAGYNYLPVRAFPAERILELAQAARAHANRVGLVSIALCDHPEIERLLGRLGEMGYSISPASLRLDDLTPTIVGLLRASGERTLTIAPETGSDRLRRVINKTVTNDEILDRAALIFSSGIENLKLYYMIGLPTETDDDLVAMRDQVVQLRDLMLTHAKARGSVGRIVGSVNPLVPKPGTAYQWLPMADARDIERKMKRLRTLVDGLDHVYFSIKSERHSYYQALLSLGDRRVAPAIEAAERNGGQWRPAVREAEVDADFYISRDRSGDRVLPWDIIDGGMKHAFFRQEFAKGQRAEWTLPPKRQQENARLLTVLS
ncbi:MAG: radical SAM protein [Vicinamibacterales bacterium]